MPTLADALNVALQFHQAGHLGKAEQIYRQILAVQPNHADALHLLGLAASQQGRQDQAIRLIAQAIASDGRQAHYHINLGNAFNVQGTLDKAAACYRRALELDPHFAEAHFNLGNCLKDQGKLVEAVACYCRALKLKPGYAKAHNNLGTALKSQGKLDEAVACYRRALELKPDWAEAHYNLATAWKDLGSLGEAISSFCKALGLKPDYAEAHYNLGNCLYGKGKLDEAVSCYRRALELKPAYAMAHNNLGAALNEQGKLVEAVACHRRALQLMPHFAEAHNNLGAALKKQGELDEAVACYRRALELKPDFAAAHQNLGLALDDRGKLDEAIACYRRALELKPDSPDAYCSLGSAFKAQGKLDEAVACYCRALELKPDYAEAHSNLGNALNDRDKLDEAVACYRRALELKPDYAEAHNNLGNTLKDQGKLDEAVACYRRALELKPDYAEAYCNLLCIIQVFCSGYDPQAILEEHRRWNQLQAEPLARFIQPHANDRSPNRRLRIGYVSPYFRNHCQAFFMVPLLSCHDHRNHEIFCYADLACPDRISTRLRSYADSWRNITGRNDVQVADLVRQDQIDILVDLAMHMDRNRLLAFARRPAPVQVCWLAYPGTTGLGVMDYRFTDPHLDPPGFKDACYSEKSVRLPDSFWCYDPLTQEPAVNNLPALANAYITFGCLNNFCKVNVPTLKLWAKILRAIDSSRLILLTPEGTARQWVLDVLAAEGIDADRLIFVARQPRPQYLEVYRRIDIALDTLPANGHTTSLDSYWMGVPVVTLVGATIAGRAGLCQLRNLDLGELIASTADEFVSIVVDLAHDLPRLGKLRAGLRERMQNSPLMDAPRFARNVEAAYRMMWQRWCAM
jgi:predicted O-linked N-acetylglucosamine transferase (SPINDLY family)